MSNNELTQHALRTSADILELNSKAEEIKCVQDEHTQRFNSIDKRFDLVDQRFDRLEQRLDKVEQRLDTVEQRLDAHIARSEDFFRKTDASLLEIRDLLGKILQRIG